MKINKSKQGWGPGAAPPLDSAVARLFDVGDLERRARRRIPRFAFDFLAGGANDEVCLQANRSALANIQLIPRYGVGLEGLSTTTTLFGRQYRTPIGVAPMGFVGLVWPHGDAHLAAAAQAAGAPYVLSTVASMSIEAAAAHAPDVWWFQLYGAPDNDHALSKKLVQRAQAAQAHVLVVTLDVPTRSRRLRDSRNRLVFPFRPDLRTLWQVARAQPWAWAMLLRGAPRFENLLEYLPPGSDSQTVAGFSAQAIRDPTTWDAVKRIRDEWQGPLVVKGIMHPDDVDLAIASGVDGIWVSNHGGRQLDAAPGSADVLPGIVERVNHRAAVLFDGGIRSGVDAVRALAIGADAVFAGRAFAYAAAAVDIKGPKHLFALWNSELESVLGQLGVRSVSEAAQIASHHPSAIKFDL